MKLFTYLILIIGSLNVFSQNVKLSKNQLNANILPMTITYEGKVSNNMSFTIGGGVSPKVIFETRTNSFTGQTDADLFLFLQPYITSSFRSYYERNNVKKRDLKKNSGNYIGMFYAHQFAPFGSTDNTFEQRMREQETNVFVIGPVWGIQRNYANGFHLDFNIGIGYKNGQYLKGGDASLIGGLEIGYVLFSK